MLHRGRFFILPEKDSILAIQKNLNELYGTSSQRNSVCITRAR